MQIVSLGYSLYEMSDPILWEEFENFHSYIVLVSPLGY